MRLRWLPIKVKYWVIFFLVGLVLSAFYFIFESWKLVNHYPIEHWLVLENADCGVVLTGGRGRLKWALEVYRKENVQHLIISGVHPDTQIEDLIHWYDEIYRLGLPNLYLEKNSQTTYGNAQNSYLLLEKLNCSSFYLMTSRTHMARALLTFLHHPKSPQFLLIPRALPASDYEEGFWAKWEETTKLLFYRFLFFIGFF